MAINIEEILINKVRTLPPETQQQVLDFLEALPPAEHPKQTIWEKIRERASEVPDEVWEQMPVDGAEQHDHYLYGTPKK